MALRIGVTPGAGSVSRFVVPAILAAAGIGLMVWHRQQQLGLTGWQRYVPYAMGGLFVFAGLRSIVTELRRGADREAAERALKEHRDAPWRVRPEWRSNELVAGAPVSRFLLAFALFWNAVSWPAAVLIIRSEYQAGGGSTEPGVWAMALFPAIGLGMLGKLAYEVLRVWKFGRTRVALDAMPLRLGRSCRGRMRVKLRRDAMPEDGFLVKVSCYRQRVRYVRDSDGDRKRRIERDLLWRDESRFQGDPAMDGTAVEVPFAFTLPRDMPSSTPLKLEERMLWEVSVEAEVPGIDFRAAVEVPVFPPDAAAAEDGVIPGMASDAEAVEIGAGAGPGDAAGDAALVGPLEKPLSDGIVLVDEPDLFELHFTAARKRKGAVVLGMVGAVFLLSGFPLMAASGLVGLIFLLMGGFLVYGSIQQGTNDTVLRVDKGQVSVTHDGMGMPADVRFPAAQVEEVVVDLGTGSSENARYAIALVARAGEGLEHLGEQADNVMGVMSKFGIGEQHPAMEAMKKGARQPRISVADDFTDKDEADWLASRIRQAIRGEAGPDA